ncbi:MAG: twin-arginine translocation signal domain-containing protein [Bacteroidetes bacterium]|nr:twin-arginine translocation signal domain-containing protein [Bacteroidota bacterium]
MTDRRHFIKQAGVLGAGLSLVPQLALASGKSERLVILHTNDWHSRIEPFPLDGGRLQGLGGAEQRMALLQKIRNENEHVLLLDSGDMFQGTPFFNLYGGELEFRLMSEMGYDAATLGNHDFDAGLEGLKKQLHHANFPILSANYDFSETELKGAFQPYHILRKGPFKIGLFGIGIQLKGLVPEPLYGRTRYLDPLTIANETANYLKKKQNCDTVICLSHLGYKYSDSKISDVILASESEEIDIILGGHTHTFMDKPVEILNKMKQPVIINQVGWGGVILGRLDLIWNKGKIGANPHNTMLKVS